MARYSYRTTELFTVMMIALLVLSLSSMSCSQKGKADAELPSQQLSLEEPELTVGKPVTFDDLRTQTKASIRSEITVLEHREDEVSVMRRNKLLGQQEQLDVLDAELHDWNNKVAAKKEEYRAARERKKKERAEELGEEVENFSLFVVEGKPDASDPKYNQALADFMKIFAAARVLTATALRGPVAGIVSAAITIGIELGVDTEHKLKILEDGKAGALFEDDIDAPVKIEFCKDPLGNNCKSFVALAHLNTTFHILYLKMDDIVDFRDVGMNDTRVIKLCATDETPSFRGGGVQVVINERVFYLSPFIGANVTTKCISLNQRDDWVAIFAGRTRDKNWDSGKRCTKDGIQGHLYASFPVEVTPLLERHIRDRSAESWMTEVLLSDEKDAVMLRLRSPSNAWFKDMRTLNAVTLSLGEAQTFTDVDGQPRFSVRLLGDICFECAWCSDWFRFSLMRVSDLVNIANADEPKVMKCSTYRRGRNYTFKRGFRLRGPYVMVEQNCSFVTEYTGEGIAEEGLFLPMTAYQHALQIVKAMPGVYEPPKFIPEAMPAEVVQNARDALRRGRAALAVVGEAQEGEMPQGNLIALVEEKKREVDQAFAAATDRVQKECLTFEGIIWNDMARALWLDSLRATIAFRRAQYALLDGEIKHMNAGNNDNLLLQAERILEEVNDHVAVVEAEKNAAIMTFETPCPEQCCAQTVLKLVTDDEVAPDAAESIDLPPVEIQGMQ